MDGRSPVILASLALLSAAAGCIAPGLTQNNAELELTAFQARPPADAAAEAWRPGAQLVAIFTLESADANEPIPADALPGNGRAPVWNFAYRAPDGGVRAFLSFVDGTVVAQNETYGAEQYADQATPLTDVRLDSSDAVESAALDESFRAALNGANLTLAQGIAHWEGTTAWYFAALSDAGSVVALVDAVTGDLLWVEPFSLSGLDFGKYAQNGFAYRPPAEPLHVESEGRLTRAAPRAEVPFTADGFSHDARLRLDVTKETPADALSWRVVKVDGEDEEEVARGTVGRSPFAGAESAIHEFELDGAGDYRLDLWYRSVTLVSVGAVDYVLTLDVGALPEVEDAP